MASDDFLDSENDRFRLQSARSGNLSAPRERRAAVSFTSDANKTLLNTEYECPIIDIGSGTSLTTTRNLVFPLTDGGRWLVNNQSTGGQSVQCIGASGTGVTIATGKAARIWCDGTNIKRETADVTP